VTGSRYPIRDTDFSQRRWPPSKWAPENALRCVIETPKVRIRFINVHLETPREGISAVLNRGTLISPSRSDALTERIECRRLESEELVGWIGQSSEPVLIAGDFNMPADSTIYRQSWAKYTNAFSAAGTGFGHTKHTEVLGRQYGSRIDHILAGPGWRPCRSWVHLDLGSDHLPLLADLLWKDAHQRAGSSLP
jgi:endonuclease/exonuclease/phosphatase family metal-dependent hydrolase